jgi:chloride channel protein, CIC family
MPANPQLLKKFILWRAEKITDRNFLLILSLIIGLCTGIAAVVLKFLAHYIREELVKDYENPYENYLFFALPFFGILITVLFFRTFIKEKVGHGVSSILFAISRRKGHLKPHKMYSSVVGSAFTVGFGGSVGLEAPIVSTGSAIGSNIGRLFKLDYKYIVLLIGCGATGAISAIFNTPIAAVVFALEVLMLDLSLASLLPLLLASVAGTVTANLIYSEKVLFYISLHNSFEAEDIPFYILLGAFCGLVSVYFTRSEMWTERRIGKIKNAYVKALVGGIMLGALIFLFPPLYGEGYDSIKSLLAEIPSVLLGHSLIFKYHTIELIALGFLFLVLLLKPLATAITIGSGGAGGIFAPSLFMGAGSGFLLARIINDINLPWKVSESTFAMVGMAGLMAGVLHAPLTAMFLIAELTGGYQLIVPLMIVSGISLFVAKSIEPHSIYTKRLAQKGQLITHHKDKAVLTLMTMREVIENDFETISPEASLGELVKSVAKSKRNIFPVVDSDDQLMGIVLLDDIREIMFNPGMYDKTRVDELMSPPPAKINVSDSMEKVMNVFTQTGAWNLPVTDNGKYQGFISKSKMFSAYRKRLIQFSVE